MRSAPLAESEPSDVDLLVVVDPEVLEPTCTHLPLDQRSMRLVQRA
jgi:hypothetical protein